MRKILLLSLLAASLFAVPAAHADWTGKDASAATITFKNPNTCSSVVCVPVVQLYDGTNVVTLTTAGADAVSNTLTGLPVYSRGLVFNGTTWDRWTGAVTVAGVATSANQTNGTQKSQTVDGSGNVQPSGDVAARAIFQKVTDGTNTATVKAASTNASATDTAIVADPRPNSAATVSGSTTNPTATLTLPATTTAYTAGQLIANSATAGSVVNPSFAIANSAGGAVISRLRLSTNDTTSTAWGGQTIQVDLWTATPTWTNGDRGTWSPATGAASHLGAFTCVMSSEFGDGAFGECSAAVGNFAAVKLASGTSVFWSLQAVTGSGVTGVSKVFTVAAEVLN